MGRHQVTFTKGTHCQKMERSTALFLPLLLFVVVFFQEGLGLKCWHTGKTTAGYALVTSERSAQCVREAYTVSPTSDVYFRLGCSLPNLKLLLKKEENSTRGTGWHSQAYCSEDFCNSPPTTSTSTTSPVPLPRVAHNVDDIHQAGFPKTPVMILILTIVVIIATVVILACILKK